jgi:hypothetical protein
MALTWSGKAAVHDLAGKYGDWLFKQPLLLGLARSGVLLLPVRNPYPMAVKAGTGSKPGLALVFSRADREIVDAGFAARYRQVVELRRKDRFTEEVIIWRKGRITRRRSFRAAREQERVRQIASYLNIPYEERTVRVLPPAGKRVAVSLSVGERSGARLDFDLAELQKTVDLLRKQGYSFQVIRAEGEANERVLRFYATFRKSEIVRTGTFAEACAVIRKTDLFLGADSGLAHFAVNEGKLACALFSKRHHGAEPLFQSTFRNHLCFFGDEFHARDLVDMLASLAYPAVRASEVRAVREFLRTGRGIDPDPYSNARKLFVLRISFVSQGREFAAMAREIHSRSASIFFTDEVSSADIREMKERRGKLFINSRAFVNDLAALFGGAPASMYAKECSLFYGTAMRDGSSDVDFPTLVLPAGRASAPLLSRVERLLKRYGFSTELPHQAPITAASRRMPPGFLPLIEAGRPAYAATRQSSPENMQKYEARLKLKIVAGEMSAPERAELATLLSTDEMGRNLLREIGLLERDAREFKEWQSFIRKICRATAAFGKFGAKGHVFLRVKRRDCAKTAKIIGGLMRHGIVYAAGERIYPVWNIRRPQHGWYQPITLLAEDRKPFSIAVRQALRSPIYASGSFGKLKKIVRGKISVPETISLLESPDPLVFMEAYRSISARAERAAMPARSRKELKDYAKERESNCNSPRDRRLSLWSLATGKPLPIPAEDISGLTKYNCFAQVLAARGTVSFEDTGFFRHASRVKESAKDFTEPFRRRLVRLLREYYLYSLCSGIPPQYLHEKKKEILFFYCVQGRVLLEGPAAQARNAEKILREFDAMRILADGRVLREAIKASRGPASGTSGEFLLLWLLRHGDADPASFFSRGKYLFGTASDAFLAAE